MARKSCFVISPIGESGSPTRKRADQIYNYVIKAVLDEEDWFVERADKIDEPGIITNQIIERLVGADLVIADLSERNPNVFYELAVRHILRKPYVHLIAHDEDIPFDNAPVRAIKIDIQDLDSVDLAKRELAAQVTHTLSEGAEVESPVSVAISLSDLKKSGDKEGILLQSLSSEMSGLRRIVSELSSKIEYVSSANTTGLARWISSANAYPTNALAVESSKASAVNSLLQDYLTREAVNANTDATNALAAALGSSSPPPSPPPSTRPQSSKKR